MVGKFFMALIIQIRNWNNGHRKFKIGEKTEGNPRHPVDIAAELKAPVLGLYGGADTGISLESVEQMRAALAQAASKNPAAKASLIAYIIDMGAIK